MKDKPHLVNAIFSLICLGLGVIGVIGFYLEKGEFAPTALIPAIFGLILMPMSNGIKKENKVVAHIVVVLTLIIAVMAIKMLPASYANGFSRKAFIFTVLTSASIWALVTYIQGFIAKKKARLAAKQ